MPKKKSKKLPFGGLKIDLRKYRDVKLGEIFPNKPISATEVNKYFWAWMKRRKRYIFVK